MNNKIKVAICDDHMIERTIIQIYIDEYFRGKAASAEVKEFCSGTEFIETDVTPYDLLRNLPYNGFSLSNHILGGS